VTAPAPAAPGEPSGFVDALRGLALAGIAVIHMEWFLRPYQHPAVQGGADRAVTFLSGLLAEGKFFPLFAFLFGFGIGAQAARGLGTVAMARRLLLLAGLGALHAALLFSGDILTTYALLGALLWGLRGRPDRTLLRLAAGAVVLAMLSQGLAGGIVALLTPGVLSAETRPAAEVIGLMTGPFRAAVAYRVAEEVPFALVGNILFNGPLSLAAACLGMVAARRGLLREPEALLAALARWRGLLVAGAVLGNGAGAALAWRAGWPAAAGSFLWPLGMACLAALYALGLARLWARPGPRRALAPLAAAGRMSLTIYLGQSLVAGAVFMGWGLGLYGQGSRWMAPLLGLALAALLCALAQAWLRRFRMGPLEWLLRAGTTLRLPPLRRAAA
jgi:uncharacterized protein